MKGKGLLTVLFVASLLGVGFLVRAISVADPDGAMYRLELAGSAAAMRTLVADPAVGGAIDVTRARQAIAWDYLLIACYVLFLWTAISLAAGWPRQDPPWPGGWIVWIPALAGGLDALADRGVVALLDGDRSAWLPPAVAAAAWLVRLLVLGTLFAAVVTAVRRWRSHGEAARAVRISGPTSFDEVCRAERDALGLGRRNVGTVGLALSGGGIRSATFNLGILQALADLGLLQRLHYLSTVSGGGYIGAWLDQWIRRAGGVHAVAEALADDPNQAKPEVDPITHLRNYSNYLTPKLGLLSADTWATVATYVRNMLLNAVILVSLAGFVLLLPRAFVDWLEHLSRVYASWPFNRFVLGGVTVAESWALWVAVPLVLTAIISIGVNLAAAVTRVDGPRERFTSQGAVQRLAVLPLVAASVLAAFWLRAITVPDRFSDELWQWVTGALLLYAATWAAATLVAWVAAGRGDVGQWSRLGIRFLICSLPVGAAGGLALRGLAHLFDPWSVWGLIVVGPSAVMMLFTLIAVLHIGLMGRSLDDHLREWLARAGAWITIYSLGWLALNGLALYGPVAGAWLGGWLRTALASGWLLTSIGGAVAGNAQQQGRRRAWHGPLLKVAPWVFVVGLVVSLSWGIDRVLCRHTPDAWARFIAASKASEAVETVDYESATTSVSVRRRPEAGAEPRSLLALHAHLLDLQQREGEFWWWMIGLAATSILFSWRVAINEFSMHQYYRNRLVRAYLGASNSQRRENPFTGFDPYDDGPLAMDRPLQPLHLVGTALNLVHGSRLGWQERKAASFVLSPLYSGFELPADVGQEKPDSVFRRTAEAEELTLGTAMAISGAAASPNMGFRSSPALSLLMTVFDVRLGRWLGNPAHLGAWRRGVPRFALVPLIAELFGLTSERSHYVYLSDGGHFENLGIYELVRRRCRFVIACDAGADAESTFADLGNAIRKCRTDFGAQIELGLDPFTRDDRGLSRRHCVVGRIRYAAQCAGGPEDTGYLLYIKTSLTGDEPEDVLQYAAEHDAFPHESTIDQFFDESQFESYRALGRHIGRRVFESASHQTGDRFRSWESLFSEVLERWTPPSAAASRAASDHGAALTRLFERLSDQSTLDFFDPEMYPEWSDLSARAGSAGWAYTAPQIRNGFYLSSSLLQLMESVYVDLQLDDEYRHPDNRGWMNLFRQWSDSPLVRATWAITAGTHGARFQTFCKRRLGLQHGTVRAAVTSVDRFGAIDVEWRDVGQRVRERVASPPPGVLGHWWIELKVEIEDPPLAVPAGFALAESRAVEQGTSTDHLLYFQVPVHLRRTGLAQQGLYELAREFRGLEPIAEALRIDAIPLKTWRAFGSLYDRSVS
jgi:Patatin-like phospholipase